MNHKKIAEDKTLKDTVEIVRLASNAKGITDISVGQPDFKPPRGILKQGYEGYGPVGGYKELRELIAKKFGKENKIKTSAENIIVTTGSLEGIILCLLSVADNKNEVLVPNPGFITYDDAVLLTGAKPVYYNFTKDCRIDIKSIKRKITKKTKAIILNSPGNPMGNVFSRKELKELVKVLKSKKIYVISDEVYEKYTYGKPHISIGEFEEIKDKVITVNSFSKTYGIPGWRIGYMNVPISLVGTIKNIKISTSICAPTISQMAAVRLLKGKDSFIRKNIIVFKRRRREMIKMLDRMNVNYAVLEGSFYVWLDLRYLKKKSMKIFKELLERGLMVMPGNIFGKNGEGYIRLSYAKDMKAIRKGMKILGKYLPRKAL
ncbi:MAG: pyridoxal phosphate-dependent aminotransferase, partial [Candidatus Aenigmarchaeota archaeon]|nr:pyridoxal phosphate-dependent aminotransferase [Candidatus Aenigmarchaeota archaeon]